MRIVLESLRFIGIYFLLLTILGVITYLILSSFGLNAEKYSWTAIVSAFILIFVLYKKMGWGEGYNNPILCISLMLIIIFSLLIPDTNLFISMVSRLSY
ncbi:hypothetical protein CR203_14800 [Salipaludibacillus neizhouensis]|uniref:Uncharacterized protein n=1 Tax=Salipaludibacillus neizhouensis TaxID=885475 RepID=A0A3A9KFY2_9BACI|nr:hypothetical protein [Salipaludibacillus neizhouensis]RKL66555.1 hypothetical protein CR203_14800 [Salipaludibacillus neizhouensis]